MVFSRSFLIVAALILAACSPAPLVQTTPPKAKPVEAPPVAAVIAPAPLKIKANKLTAKARDLITDFEVSATDSSHSYYDRHYQKPTWPQGDSGVTVGIGVDLGMQSETVTQESWQEFLDAGAVKRLANCAGVTGSKAKSLTATLQDIKIGWDDALAEFLGYEVTKYWSLTERTFPGFNNLTVNAQGALVSLVYNRGSSMAGPSRVDMRDVRTAAARADYEGMAEAVRHMEVTMEKPWRAAGIFEGLKARTEATADLILSN